MSSSSSWQRSLRRFTLPELQEATENFTAHKKRRDQSSSTDYEGLVFIDPTKTRIPVTVTYLRRELPGLPVLERLCRLDHENLASLVGYCSERSTNFLVYENVPATGTLEDQFVEQNGELACRLSWEQRLIVLIGAAQGLETLHRRADVPIVHCRFGPSCILLDGNFSAMVSGLEYCTVGEDPYSRFFYDNSDADYAAPELREGLISDKMNVYAMGVLLNLVMKLPDFVPPPTYSTIPTHFTGVPMRARRVSRGHHREWSKKISTSCRSLCTDLANKCSTIDPTERPSMTRVVELLQLALQVQKNDEFAIQEMEAKLKRVESQGHCLSFSISDINKATGNFGESQFLGKGGEAMVYWGMVNINSITTHVAVKLLVTESHQFLEEIETVSRFNHPNIVSLLGFCNEDDKRILVYEYMHNGSLYDHLYKSHDFLPWEKRLEICIGIAHGLYYLHFKMNPPVGVIHRDLKPANILLDAYWNAKISDFGMFKMRDSDMQGSTIISKQKGTFGYFAPEYASEGKLSRKVDVYAFGVVLFEVLCKKRPWDREDSYTGDETENDNIGTWARENVDADLRGRISQECLQAFTDLVGKCMKFDREARPDMHEVLLELRMALEFQKQGN